MTDVRDAQMVARTSDGRLVRRPLSPHMQVYRPQITTVISFAHRITGVGLGIGTLLLTWWLVAAATSAEAFGTVQGFIGSPIGLLLLFGWTFALFFHLAMQRHPPSGVGSGAGLREGEDAHLTSWSGCHRRVGPEPVPGMDRRPCDLVRAAMPDTNKAVEVHIRRSQLGRARGLGAAKLPTRRIGGRRSG